MKLPAKLEPDLVSSMRALQFLEKEAKHLSNNGEFSTAVAARYFATLGFARRMSRDAAREAHFFPKYDDMLKKIRWRLKHMIKRA
jgi:hypothetical protein